MRTITKFRLPFFYLVAAILITGIMPLHGPEQWWVVGPLMLGGFALVQWVHHRVRCPVCDARPRDHGGGTLPDRCPVCNADFRAEPPSTPSHPPHPWLSWPVITWRSVVGGVLSLTSLACILILAFDPKRRWWIPVGVNTIVFFIAFALRDWLRDASDKRPPS